MQLAIRICYVRTTEIVPVLVEWFSRNARDLPWRRTRDPYAIWVSEIMLQQTQVQTVLPYWSRWMRALPTISALAKARPATIHKLWAGLGYYSRVRNLQCAAREILDEHGGKLPEHYAELLALPGIGRYTAGAICSIAFNQPCPVVDGNVIRVLSRVFAIRGNPKESETNARLWGVAEQLVQNAAKLNGPSNCSNLNQSLMELGALLCTPRTPDCGSCPLCNHCVARREGRVNELPELPSRPRATKRRLAAFVVERRGKYFVRQRPNGVVNGSLWEFPNAELLRDGGLRTAARAVLGVVPKALEPALTVKHSITRYRITMHVYRAQINLRGNGLAGSGAWQRLDELSKLPFPSAHRKIVDWLSAAAGS